MTLTLMVTSFCMLLVTSDALAVSVSLHAESQGISALNVNVSGTTITIDETWTSITPGLLLFNELNESTDYTIVKNITNNTGEAWTSLANELLDPSGQAEDSADPAPLPNFVPATFSTSNDNDGLSFAQGSGLPRTSTIFPSLTVDELTDARDFLDFFGGTLSPGGSATFTYGIRENFDTQQPFLLSQRPNVFSMPQDPGQPIPEPSTLLLFGTGMLGLLGYASRRKRNTQPEA